jgi:hypothetical protein
MQAVAVELQILIQLLELVEPVAVVTVEQEQVARVVVTE